MRNSLLFLALFVFCKTGDSYTTITVYERANFKGKSVNVRDLDTIGYVWFGYFNDKTTSYKITSGSCVEMHMHSPPYYGGTNNWFVATSDSSNIGSTYNDKLSSVKGCGSYSKSLQCPSGTFVKKILWDNSNSMRNGVELHCYTPESKSARSIVRSHGSGGVNGKTECNAVRGIRFTRDFRKEADINMAPFCNQGSSAGNTIACGDGEAVTGLRLIIENRSNYIKSSSLVCGKVGKIESTCKPKDRLNTLITCDGSYALFPFTCAQAKTVGYGYSKVMSEEKRNEQNFYQELGFEIGVAGFGLSTNFKATLGSSTTTGYSWSTAEERTFHEEETITVQMEAFPGCVSQLLEVIGECSFIQVSPNYFKRQDKCRNATYISNVEMPMKLGKKAVFISKVPEEVRNSNLIK